jgi:hypothetical protein
MPPELIILLGQLLGIAAAAGLNLYATLLVLGLASRSGGAFELPPELLGLEHGLLLGTAATLAVAELAAARHAAVNAVWQTLHTAIRPVAAGLLAFGLLAALPDAAQAAGAVLAGGVALAVHGARSGLRLAIAAGAVRPLAGALEESAAVALAVLAIAYPPAAMAVVALSLPVAALLGPRLWRAFALWLRALSAGVRGFFGPRGWVAIDRLPRRLRRIAPPQALAQAPPRAARAAIAGLPGIGAYTSGWLVHAPDGYRFLYDSLLGPRQRLLPVGLVRSIRPGRWLDAVRVEAPGGGFTLFLLKDGPPAEEALAELVHA